MTAPYDNSIQNYNVTFNSTLIPQVDAIGELEFTMASYSGIYFGQNSEYSSPTYAKATGVTLTCGYDPTQHGFLTTAMFAKTKANLVYVAQPPAGVSGPGTATFTVLAYVESFKLPGGNPDAQAKAEVKFKFSGDITVS